MSGRIRMWSFWLSEGRSSREQTKEWLWRCPPLRLEHMPRDSPAPCQIRCEQREWREHTDRWKHEAPGLLLLLLLLLLLRLAAPAWFTALGFAVALASSPRSGGGVLRCADSAL